MPTFIFIIIGLFFVYIDRAFLPIAIAIAFFYFFPQLIAPFILLIIFVPDILSSKPSAPAKK